jgi:hypothetical protein
VPFRTATADDLAGHLEWALGEPGPAAVILKAHLVAAQPTA